MMEKIIVATLKVINAILRGIANGLETAAGSSSRGYSDGIMKVDREVKRIENQRISREKHEAKRRLNG